MWWAHVARSRALAQPDRIAVADDVAARTFAELDACSSRLAHVLADRHGVGAGDRVAVVSRNRVEVFEALIAIAKCGAVSMPLNPALTESEVAEQLADAPVRAVLADSEGLRALGSARAAQVLCFDEPEYEALLGSAVEAPVVASGPGAVATLLSTSATTGRAKRVALTNASLAASTRSWLATAPVGPDDVLLSATPLYHSTVTIVMAFLFAGAQIAVMRQLTAQRLLDAIERHRATHLYLVPSMVTFCLRARSLAQTDTSSVRELVHGASPMPCELRQRAAEAFGCALRDCYGQAEAGGPITLLDPMTAADFAHDDPRQHSVGRPLEGVELRVVDDGGRLLPAGARGEVEVRSASLMQGYDGDPAASAAALRDGWLATGDIGYLDAAGYLHLHERKADVLIRGGQNVYPAEIERVLSTHPGVAEVAVVGATDTDWGEVPVAFVVPAALPPEKATLLQFARLQLAPHKRPVGVAFVDELPRNAAGKILKRRLRDQLVEAYRSDA
jgi:acyl-CoA synthetase (AMP-forming)/AMP-acid ligase II